MPAMREEREKPGVVFWSTLAIAVVVLYPLSFGPVLWLNTHGWLTGWPHDLAVWFYFPINWIYHKGPQPVHDVFDLYARLWGS